MFLGSQVEHPWSHPINAFIISNIHLLIFTRIFHLYTYAYLTSPYRKHIYTPTLNENIIPFLVDIYSLITFKKKSHLALGISSNIGLSTQSSNNRPCVDLVALHWYHWSFPSLTSFDCSLRRRDSGSRFAA
jgi:hypothetical protein